MFKRATSSLRLGCRSWTWPTFATSQRLLAASTRMCDLYIRTKDLIAGDLDAHVNDALKSDKILTADCYLIAILFVFKWCHLWFISSSLRCSITASSWLAKLLSNFLPLVLSELNTSRWFSISSWISCNKDQNPKFSNFRTSRGSCTTGPNLSTPLRSTFSNNSSSANSLKLMWM